MNLLDQLFLVFIGLTCPLVRGDRCPPPEDIMPCRCRGRNDQIQVWCSHSDLDRVNGALENLMKLRNMPAIHELIVENNKMPTLPARAFGALRIGRLLLRHNGLESISRNAFAGLENSLEELYIVEERLLDFPFDSIEQLRNLEAFTIERSQIRLLPKFSGLNRLKHIRIDGSLISGLPLGAFAKMAAVKQIHLVNSKLVTLADGIFGRLESLQLANFSGNQITSIQRRSFALLPRLEVLSISHNGLEDAVSVGRACEELTSLKSLDLSHNTFQALKEGSFVHLRSLQVLNLGNNKIHSLSPRSLTHLPALRKVDLRQNHIRNVPKLFFDSSPQLEELCLRRNLLSAGNEIGDILISLRSLKILDLGENGIGQLHAGMISDHSQLEKVDLSDNVISRIHPEALRNIPSITELNLRNNSLSELQTSENDPWRLPSLKYLDLSGNKIYGLNVSSTSGFSALTRLNLSFNNIKALRSASFTQNRNLEELYLGGNGIAILGYNSFNGLGKLRHLDLSRNHLDVLESGTFRDLGSLQVLNIGNNRLPGIPNDLFSSLRNLEELSLKSNSLIQLTRGTLGALGNLKELNLKQNLLKFVNHNVFSELKNLRNLRLSSNQINTLEDGCFNGLGVLRTLDLSSNRISSMTLGSLSGCPALEKLIARENRIVTIESGVVSRLGKLRVLDLAHNAMDAVPIGLSNSAIRVLDLSHNVITKIEPGNFENSKNLTELYLNENKLVELQPKSFQNMESLTIMDLDGNEVQELRGNTFLNLPRLIYLRLSRNHLREIQNGAFVELIVLDGLDLQENELERIGEKVFEGSPSLKYLNLSHNNFEDLAGLGFYPLTSLEVLDLSYNRIRLLDEKALRHLQWLVELRVNDNGICFLPHGVFDGMSRLKMLILKNNSIGRLPEVVFYKLKNNIAILDVSGNPLNCDCELIWFRNLVSSSNFRELTESNCEAPDELRGVSINALRPARMTCSSANRLRGINPAVESKVNQKECPSLPISRRKPRPILPVPFERPVFGDTSTNEPSHGDVNGNDVKHNRKHKDEKLLGSHDYIPGDSPTIYAGSHSRPHKIPSNNAVKSPSGLSALSNLLGIQLPTFDFALPSLGISPSFSLANQESTRDRFENDRGYPVLKGPDPLPPSWLDRPSKVEPPSEIAWEPPEYIPRKPSQPYIPLNPYAESNAKPSLVSNPDSLKKFNLPPNSRSRLTTTLPQTSWHPSYPTVETGFIPIEPFFHYRQSKNNSSTITNYPNPIRQSTTPMPQGSSPHDRPIITTNRNELSSSTGTPFDLGEESTESQTDEEGDSLSDFWGLFDGSNKNSSMPPLDFSAPVDTEVETPEIEQTLASTTSEPATSPQDEVMDESRDQGKGNRGKSTITKVKLEDTSSRLYSPSPSTNALIYTNSDANEDHVTFTRKSTNFPPHHHHGQDGIPPVLIGGGEEPIDWYYRNYDLPQNPEEEIQKYLDRSRLNEIENFLVEPNASSTAQITNPVFLALLTLLFFQLLFS